MRDLQPLLGRHPSQASEAKGRKMMQVGQEGIPSADEHDELSEQPLPLSVRHGHDCLAQGQAQYYWPGKEEVVFSEALVVEIRDL
jgi:hypothetical protein